jgi:ABC-2 type transport system ATP-binding protein
MSQIIVNNLSKTYRVPERQSGLLASFRSLGKRTHRDVNAVQEIDFTIERGEVVGFIGPNGAGKTTTLKMLSGLLRPTSGNVQVIGFSPWQRKHDFLRSISMIMGNKQQIIWDVPPLDTFNVLSEIYRIPKAEYRRNLDELVDLLEMGPLLKKPVRNMSLGERMKCELVGSLLHRPKVLFLDEPTLGLDVSMQRRLRTFIKAYNQRHDATIMLTSHYMADVVELCSRVILIHHGKLIYDGNLERLVEQLAPFKLIHITMSDYRFDNGFDAEGLPQNVDVVESNNGHVTLRVGRGDAPSITSHLLNTLSIADLRVENPPIDAVIDQIYQEERA